jgi:hypothetical protein
MPRATDKPHARIYRSWLDLPAWKTLGSDARALIVDLFARYRPMEANAFEISDRTVTTLVNCSRRTGSKALSDLVDRGWLSVVRVGRIRGPKAKRASVYALTWYPLDAASSATKDFLRWQPDPIQGLKVKPSTAHFGAVNGSLQSPYSDVPHRATSETTH